MSHRWSGWPGAWCMDCGIEDPVEACLAIHDAVDDEGMPVTCEECLKLITVCQHPGEGLADPYKFDRIKH